MSTNTDTNKYTILFAIAMVVIVGSLLAFTASVKQAESSTSTPITFIFFEF